MKLKASIVITKDIDLIYKCFKPEISKWSRSSIDIKKTKKSLHFNVNAKDATALRATLNSITGLLSVYEKTNDASK